LRAGTCGYKNGFELLMARDPPRKHVALELLELVLGNREALMSDVGGCIDTCVAT
jgi:hypothetical protein